MDPILGMEPTGRQISGPAFDLVEAQSKKGLKCTVICYHDEFVEHPALIADHKEFGRFMENPGVTGLLELMANDHAESQYAYPTGTAWSVAEVIRAYADLGETCGIRAGLELAYVAAQILQEAEEKAAEFDLFNHGSLSPWHVMIKPDGQVVIIGYGFPQVEILDFLEDESLMPKEDAFRYAPPERLADEGEDLSSDLFSLSLIALELMTGRPVYDGLINDIRQQATRAEGAYRLYKWRNLIPDQVREALGRALKFDPDSRYGSATEFVYAVHDLLGTPDIEGPSLLEVMRRLKHSDGKSTPLQGGRTAALSKDELARLAAEFDDDDEEEDYSLPPPSRPRPGAEPEPSDEEEEVQRWGKVARGGRTRAERGKRERPARAGRDRPRRVGGERSTGGRERLRSSSRASESTRDVRQSRKDELRASLAQRMRDSKGSGGRRIRDEAPPEPEEEEIEELEEEPRRKEAKETDMAGEEDDKASGAAALLARLRSSAGKKPTVGGGAASGPDPTASSGARRVASAPPAPRATPSRATAPATGSRRSSKSSKRDYDNDEKVTFDVEVQGQKSRRTKIRLGDPLSETADRLSRALASIPTDLSGNLKGWYRIEQDGEWFAGHETADVLDPDQPVTLSFVPNRVVPVLFEVEGIDPPGRFQAPVGTAVPSQSLVDHLVELLDLPDGEWAVFMDGEQLEPQQILEDFAPGPGTLVVVKQ